MAFEVGEDIHAVVTNWLAHKNPIPESWKVDISPTYPMKSSDLKALGITGCSRLISQSRSNMSRLRALSELLGDLSSVIRSEFALAQTSHEVISNMSSLVTLPNEIFARILMCVVNEDQSLANPDRWRVALTLSHVNQYFRATASSCAQMWSNISQNTEMASLSLSRNKCVLLDVQLAITYTSALNVKSYDLAFERFVPDIVPHSRRWRNLGVKFAPCNPDGLKNMDRLTSAEHPGIREAFCGADVQLLESLHIRSSESYLSSNSKHFTEFDSWYSSALRYLTTVYYLPFRMPHSTLANVTRFELTITLGDNKVADILTALTKMTALEDLVLDLHPNVFEDIDDVEASQRVDLTTVRHLKIISEAPVFPPRVLKALFSSLTFSGVIALHIMMGGILARASPGEHSGRLSLSSIVASVLQHGEQFPRVEHLRLEANATAGLQSYCIGTYDYLQSRAGDIHVVAPLNLLPCLKHFTLCSNRRLLISKGELSHAAPLPLLATITIEIPFVYMCGTVKQFVSQLLFAHERQKDWTGFRELVFADAIEQDSELKERSTRIRDGKAALSWCYQTLP